MSLMHLIIGLAIFVFALLLVLFPEFRALLKGLARVFIKDMATTPEGAEAIYGEKIDEAQDSYTKADNAYRIAAGKLSTARKDMEVLKNRLAKVEDECETFVKNGKMDMAQLKSEEREEIISDIERLSQLIKAFEVASSQAKEAQ